MSFFADSNPFTQDTYWGFKLLDTLMVLNMQGQPTLILGETEESLDVLKLDDIEESIREQLTKAPLATEMLQHFLNNSPVSQVYIMQASGGILHINITSVVVPPVVGEA